MIRAGTGGAGFMNRPRRRLLGPRPPRKGSQRVQAPLPPPSAPGFIELYRSAAAAARAEIIAGLLAPAAAIAPKYFYDRLGSSLFAAICLTDEYYPTRTEALLFEAHGADIARAIGPGACLIDLGAGDCGKAGRLMAGLAPDHYVAVDISVDYVREAIQALARQHPSVRMTGIGADFSHRLDLGPNLPLSRRWFFYPGSSIGNFDPVQARAFLTRLRAQTDAEGGLLIGIDLVKPVAVLEAAYDDRLGITAAFNLNVLAHLNRLLGSDFDIRQWRHRALFNAAASRIEMHLEAREPTRVGWAGGERHWQSGERIHTENSYKFSVDGFAALLGSAGYRVEHVWRDPNDWFALVLARPAGSDPEFRVAD